jgi:hypothetical protein
MRRQRRTFRGVVDASNSNLSARVYHRPNANRSSDSGRVVGSDDYHQSARQRRNCRGELKSMGKDRTSTTATL